MNVLMISDVYFPRINGVSTSIETFRATLPAHGIDTLLVAPGYPGSEAADDAGMYRMPSRYLPFDPEDRMMRRAGIERLLPQLRERGVALVHVQTPFVAHYAGLRLARQLGVPCVATYHTFFEEYLFHYVPLLPRRWMRAAARRFSREQCNALDHIVVPSRSMADTLRNYGVTRPLHILPTGLPAASFHHGDRASFRERYGIPRERPLLLFVGRVAHEKNIDFLLDMLALLRRQRPDVLLLITGEGPALGGLRARVQTEGLEDHVRFLGYLDRHRELHDCYRAADLFVFASRTETQGLVLLESMALGTPVVALAEMGTRDILEPGRGCLSAPPDPAGFAALVARTLGDTTGLQALGVAAQSYARDWSADQMAGRLAGLYRSWVDEHRERAGRPASAPPLGRSARNA